MADMVPIDLIKTDYQSPISVVSLLIEDNKTIVESTKF